MTSRYPSAISIDTITTGSSDSSIVIDRKTASCTKHIPYWGRKINGRSRGLVGRAHIPDQGPVSEQTGHELHAVKMLDGALRLRSREIKATSTSWSRCPVLRGRPHRRRSPSSTIAHDQASVATCGVAHPEPWHGLRNHAEGLWESGAARQESRLQSSPV